MNEQSTAASVDICKIDVRNCDTPVIKDEIALPYGASPSYLGRAECARHRAALRYQRLFLHSLDSFTQLIDFYVKEHNTQMPHHAFGGQTPDEIYFDQADRVQDRLHAARRQARRARMEVNRGESCRVCGPPFTPQSVSVFDAVANAPP